MSVLTLLMVALLVACLFYTMDLMFKVNTDIKYIRHLLEKNQHKE